MYTSLIFINAKIITTKQIISHGWLKTKGKLISNIAEGVYNEPFETNNKIINCEGKIIIPGFIDIHVHGGYDINFMDNTQPFPKLINNFAQKVVSEGVTKFYAATVSDDKKRLDDFFINAGLFFEQEQLDGQAKLMGCYLEGPFLSEKFKGAHDLRFLVDPKIDWIKSWQKLCQNKLKFVAFAPERDKKLFNKKSNFISQLYKLNIIPSIAHSAATFLEIEQAFKNGVKHATHLYNGMSAFNHRDPGCVPAILDKKEIIAELICDGVHVNHDILRLTYKIKGANSIIMVSDANSAKGCPDGEYLLGTLPIIKRGNTTVLKSDGISIAGSVSTMINGFNNLLIATNYNWRDCVKMSSYNAAKQLNLSHITGDLSINLLADFVLLNDNNTINSTICEGKIAFQQ